MPYPRAILPRVYGYAYRFFFVVIILVCGDFDRVFIPHVLTYFGFGGHNSYSYTVLFTRAQHEKNTKSRLPTLEDEKLRIFRVFQTIALVDFQRFLDHIQEKHSMSL